MPQERPGAAFYTTATKITKHNDPCTENGMVGVAVKQVPVSSIAGLTGVQDIQVGEKFIIRPKGTKEVPTTAGSKGVGIAAGTLGAAVYIKAASNLLVLAGGAASGDVPFGRIVELPGQQGRGVPTGFARVDCDQKDTLAAI